MKKIGWFCLVMVLGFGSVGAQDGIWRVEPMHWWVGMVNPELQIMVYGDRIAEQPVKINYPGIRVNRIEKTDNPNYLFIYLDLSGNPKPGTMNIRLGQSTVKYPLKEREAGSAERQGYGAEDVIYLITPDRFANGDPQNDAMPGMLEKPDRKNAFGRHGGDLKGIIDHLEYLCAMGYTALWLNPVVENNMPRQSYHGYAATDFYRIDPRFGSLDDYLLLSRECQKRDMKLIMDQIMNHCGSEHWWMKDLPAADWIHHDGEFVPTSHMRVTLNDPYAADSDIKRFTDGWFVPTMPDMNQDNPLLGDYLIQNSIWWVEEAGLQGIRHDTHPYAGKEFMQAYSCRIMAEYPNFNMVGEEWSVNPAIIAKWQAGKVNPDGMTSCMPGMFDFPLQVALSESLREPEAWNTGWIKVYEMLSNDFMYADPFNLVTFTDNHDMDRFYTQVDEDENLFMMGMAYLACMRGIPQIYYGTELLLTNAQPGNHGLIRADFPGGWAGDVKDGFSQTGLSALELSAQEYLKKLLNWIKNCEVIHQGDLIHYAPDKGIYLFFRYLKDRSVMVVFNKADHRQQFQPERYPEMLSGIESGWDVMQDSTVKLSNFELLPRSVSIVELKR